VRARAAARSDPRPARRASPLRRRAACPPRAVREVAARRPRARQADPQAARWTPARRPTASAHRPPAVYRPADDRPQRRPTVPRHPVFCSRLCPTPGRRSVACRRAARGRRPVGRLGGWLRRAGGRRGGRRARSLPRLLGTGRGAVAVLAPHPPPHPENGVQRLGDDVGVALLGQQASERGGADGQDQGVVLHRAHGGADQQRRRALLALLDGVLDLLPDPSDVGRAEGGTRRRIVLLGSATRRPGQCGRGSLAWRPGGCAVDATAERTGVGRRPGGRSRRRVTRGRRRPRGHPCRRRRRRVNSRSSTARQGCLRHRCPIPAARKGRRGARTLATWRSPCDPASALSSSARHSSSRSALPSTPPHPGCGIATRPGSTTASRKSRCLSIPQEELTALQEENAQ